MSLINCEINPILTWLEDIVLYYFLCNWRGNTKLYVLVTPLSTQDNEKLLEQLKSSFKRAINRNKYQTKITSEAENQYLDFLTDPSFQGVNRRFVFSFEGDRKVHAGHYLPEV